jgi:hypothetical protein
MLKSSIAHVQKSTRKMLLVLQSAVLVTAGVAPFTLVSSASAAPQLPNREARITTARPSQTFDITFEFDTTTLGTATAVQAAEFEFCDTPLGTCNTVNTPVIPASSTPSEGGWVTTNEATAFGTYTRQGGDSGGTNNQIQVQRTDTDDQRTLTGVTVGFTGLTHNATANRTFYPRIRLYSDTSATTLVWEGVVAQSTSQTLTVNARVQEILQFCVGSTGVDDATTSVGAACSNVTGTDVDLGVIESGSVSVSPVAAVSGGDNENGVAMIRTNAVNGAVIDYKAVQETSSGKLKVVGAACSGTSPTDQCFNSVGTTQASIAAGTENFGMTIAGINCGSTTSYTCTFASGAYNLVRDAAYDGDGTNTYQTGTANGFAWDDTGTADRIASSAGSSVKVIDDEALILKFAATSSITTPTGQYTVQADFIATPTF